MKKKSYVFREFSWKNMQFKIQQNEQNVSYTAEKKTIKNAFLLLTYTFCFVALVYSL